jgi:NADH-quinone oxidoreductase subunit D
MFERRLCRRNPVSGGGVAKGRSPSHRVPDHESLLMDVEARKVIELGYGGNERLVMNMGPQHPSAHGVFRAILTLEGETIVAVDAVIGYLHRCHEKLGESLTYAQYPSIASKTDYVAAMTSELAYVVAAEKVGGIDVPKRAQYLRVLVAELQRIASHCLWLGTWCLDMGGALGGGATVFLYCIREREMILDLFEALTGARLLYGFHQVGGTRYDLPAGWTDQCHATVNFVEKRIAEYEAMLDDNAFFLVRTQGVGVISPELAQEIGVAGPLIRGSGIEYDVRRSDPYSSYEDFDFTVPAEMAGDCWARYRVRMVEFRESIKIVRQVLDGLPEGPISSRPGLKSVGQVRIPKGEGYARVEGARGEVGCYLVSDGSPKPYRMKWRGASFSNLAVLPHIIPGHKVADVVAIMGSVDPVFGEVDR